MILRKLQSLARLLADRKYYSISYSQEGEDLILKRYFENKPNGFFIDVGAHHPKKFSNTYLLYKKGWHGINIDPMPGAMAHFNQIRQRDINLELAVSSEERDSFYYMFDEPALNGFSEKISLERAANTKYKLQKKIPVATKKLSTVLKASMPANITKIDLMNVDVEGLDLEVLRSNDWNSFRPSLILVELLGQVAMADDPVYKYLIMHEYAFYAKTHYTFFFVDCRA